MKQAIAVVGMACEYPDARSPRELWENVLAGRQAFRNMPANRLDLNDYYSHNPQDLDKTTIQKAAVIEGYSFDRNAFRVSSQVWRSTDPTHWLALDVASRALKDAGFPDGGGLPREMTGVLLGNSLTGEFSRAWLMRLRWPYVRRVVDAMLAGRGEDPQSRARFLAEMEQRYKEPFPEMNEESLAGSLANTIAGRICNYFDLSGGGFTVDGACASSLLAVSNACSALAAGDLDVALCGGVDLSLDPLELVGFARTGALTSGKMRVFDRNSDGFLPGEGCGILVLQRHEDAVAEGRRIYAVIGGWGVSSDGKGGLTRPDSNGQRMAFKRAYAKAGVQARDVAYFEGHGTGTAVGDREELKTILGARGMEAGPAAVGSVKTLIGHTKAAAGAAGLIKTVMALNTQIQPPMTGCDNPNPLLAETTLHVPDQGRLWPENAPLRAGVSAMGFGGINTHVVLESDRVRRRTSLSKQEKRLMATAQDVELFLLSAATPEELAEKLRKTAIRAQSVSQAELTDLAAYLALNLGDHPWRAGVLTSDPSQLAEHLRSLALKLEAGETSHMGKRRFLNKARENLRTGLLFPGNGAVATGAGCLEKRLPKVADLYGSVERLNHGPQTSITLSNLSGLQLLREMGLQANVFLGHSLGELTALCAAGVLNPRQLLELVQRRETLMAEHALPGGMCAVRADEKQLGPLEPDCRLAVFNGSRRLVVSGGWEALDRLRKNLKTRGVASKRLAVDQAFHSPRMEPVVPHWMKDLEQGSFQSPQAPVWSTVTGETLRSDTDLVNHLSDQLTHPVLFQQALEQASSQVDLWLEVGPGHMLAGLASEICAIPTYSVEVGEKTQPLLAGLAAAWVHGAPLKMEKLFEGRFFRPYNPDRDPVFFTNPCEQAPQTEVVPSAVPTPKKEPEEPKQVQAPIQPVENEEPASLLRELIEQKTELTLGQEEDPRMLDDLHLNSITVGALVSEAARALGKAAPANPTDYANASLLEMAEALAELPEASESPTLEDLNPPGIQPWVEAFETLWKETPALPKSRRTISEQGILVCREDHLWRDLPQDALPPVVLICLSGTRDHQVPELLLKGAELARDRQLPLAVVQDQPMAASFARTFQLEYGNLPVLVLEIPEFNDVSQTWVRRECAEIHGYSEVKITADGQRWKPVLRRLDAPGGEPCLSAEDVVLVSGGGKGILAECALEIGRHRGVAFILMGRSKPEQDTALRTNLARFQKEGIRYTYVSADVTDASQVQQAVAKGQTQLGPVTAVFHGAGLNQPAAIASLNTGHFIQTLKPKVTGLRNLLSALDVHHLKLLVSFGSIISRMGLHGEAHYGLANEWMALETEEFGRKHSDCLCITTQWAVWSGAGMGENLSSLEHLKRLGMEPIDPESGTAFLARLLASSAVKGSVVVSNRFGAPPTVDLDPPQQPFLRFLERTRLHYPGVEWIFESTLSHENDPYLLDHMVEGEPVFPTVLGMEAMTQAALALRADDRLPTAFTDLELNRPIIIPQGRDVVLRILVQRLDSQRVLAALRCSETGYHVDHFRAVLCYDTWDAPEPETPERLPHLPLDPETQLYGSLFFHSHRFAVIRGYDRLSAFHCTADLKPATDQGWFGRFHPGDLLLGDPGLRDALLHGVQVCIPNARILPVGAERISINHQGGPPVCFEAREQLREGDLFTYHIWAYDAKGLIREHWQNVSFQKIHDLETDQTSLILESSRIHRLLHGWSPNQDLNFALEPNPRTSRSQRSAQLAERLLGASVQISRRPDGKPEPVRGRELGFSHTEHISACITGLGVLACDLEALANHGENQWRDLLGAQGLDLALHLTHETGAALNEAATRIWCVRECLKKAGSNHMPVLERHNREEIRFQCGSLVVHTLKLETDGPPLILALLTQPSKVAQEAAP